ncbi:hypothetical protein D5086_019719 [Populus alba]|uniref:Uncharacterized protein n=1 Tax=Populus alba TaxID=43335 RepID=A0ACC4BIL9_POPAL
MSAGFSEMDATESKSQPRPFSIKLWPPSQNTRQMLVVRVTDNLTTKSIFTQKYGSLSKEEAEENAKKIEDVAFAIANEHYEKEPDGDGSSAVQLYAKECSKQILEVLKRGPSGKEDKEALVSEEVSAPRDTMFDISKGARSFIEAKEAEETLEPLKEPGNSYTKICFSNRSFGLEAARVAEPILASIKNQLKEVDLSDFIAGRPEAEALEVMNIFSTALEGSEGGVALSEALDTCTHLKKLDLRDNMFGVEAGVALSKALSKYAGLTEVYLSYLNLEDEGAMAIARALKESAPSLEVLDMAGNDITAEAAPIVAACIAEKQHLTKLNLAENELKDEGAIQINEGVDEVKEMFEKFPDRLGSFDENDPEGGDDEEESGEGEGDEHELETKLEKLEVNKEE